MWVLIENVCEEEMTKFWKWLLASPVFLSIMLVMNATVVAGETPSNENLNVTDNRPKDKTMAQVTSVSQLSDVQPTDWAFQALQSLVERYGCIAGYPNGTYRGNRALTRYEFAAGLNACLDRVNELIATATSELVTKQDLATLQKLQEEFAAELATLRGRVDALEAKTAELEANQFSTTTKLQGEAVAAITDVFGGNTVNDVDVRDNNTTFGRAYAWSWSLASRETTLCLPDFKQIILSTPNLGHQKVASSLQVKTVTAMSC